MSPTQTPFEEHVPKILKLNWLFKIFGWEVVWYYEYVGDVLTKSDVEWERL